MSKKIVWLNEPPPGRGTGACRSNEPIFLQAKPGKWAVLREYDIVQSAYVYRWRIALRFPLYRFVARNIDGKGIVYGCYVGKMLHEEE